MPMSVKAAVDKLQLNPGDVAILNDPFCGGTHLPDITLVSPVFLKPVVLKPGVLKKEKQPAELHLVRTKAARLLGVYYRRRVASGGMLQT